jgi:hypothetical protein
MAAKVSETHEFTVGGTPTLAIRNSAGSVKITRGPEAQVGVRVTKEVRGGFFNVADEGDLEKVQVHVTQSGDTITVETEWNKSFSFLKFVTVRIEVVTPATTNVDLRLNAGNTEMRDIGGAITAKINAGNFDGTGMTLGNGSRFTINAGNLVIRGALAPTASVDFDVNAGNLDLTLPASTATTLNARTQAGSISVSGFPVHISREIVRQQATGAFGESPSGVLSIRVDAGSVRIAAA